MIHRYALRAFVALAGLVALAARSSGQLDLPQKPPRPAPQPVEEVLPPPSRPGDVAPRKDGEPLDLPGSPGSAAAPPPAAPSAEVAASPEDLARALFRDLERARDVRLAAPLVERLLALGPAVLPVARAELGSEHAPTVLAAGRLCLVGGGAPDRAAVAERLTRPLPAEAAGTLLDDLIARDPVLASPEWLAGLLEHPTAIVRSRASQALESRVSSATLPALAPVLASKSTPARGAALELVARVPEAAAWNLLASRLGDPSARLARRAADLLARVDEAEPLLLERAFPAEGSAGPLEWDRARGYALLALVEREEARGLVLIDSSRVDSMLAGLGSAQPLVAGACAVGLARAGFRGSAASSGAWLDRDVPHQLVRAGTGAEYHNDFSSLEQPALRALGLVSGESFGVDGEAWRRWWVANASGFRARRAVLDLGPDAAARLRVSWRGAGGGEWTVLGPARAPTAGAPRTLRLDAAGAERLLAHLDSAGVFGVGRLPDAARGGALAVSLSGAGGEQEKRFSGAPSSAEWLAPLVAELDALAQDNLWQLHPDPAQAAQGFEAEQARMAAMTPLERRHELKRRLIDELRRGRGAPRDELVADLTRLYAEPGVPAAADFEPLLAALASEAAFEPHGAALCELARVAAAAPGGEKPEAEARERLLGLGLERFGPEADGELARVARDLEHSALRALALDPRARARALAAAGLLRAGAEPALEEARALLADVETTVRLAALAALAEAPREELRAEITALARHDLPALRAAAIAALVPLGGKDARDLALEAVGDPDAAVQLTGVRALADIADPASASLFAALLARGPGSPLYAEARRGLRRLGPPGLAECARLAASAGPRARREAALLLSEALAPEAAPALIELLALDPSDERVLWELSVLAGSPFGAAQSPAATVREWWGLVVHDDPLAWLLSAAERAGVGAPPRAALEGAGTAEGALFLLALAALPAPELVERAARELERLLGSELPRPASATERAQFRSELEEAVRARFGE